MFTLSSINIVVVVVSCLYTDYDLFFSIFDNFNNSSDSFTSNQTKSL